MAHRRLEELIARYPLRGIKGPVGTAQDMLDLLDGDSDKLVELEDRVAGHLGFAHVFTSVRSTTTWCRRSCTWPRARRRSP